MVYLFLTVVETIRKEEIYKIQRNLVELGDFVVDSTFVAYYFWIYGNCTYWPIHFFLAYNLHFVYSKMLMPHYVIVIVSFFGFFIKSYNIFFHNFYPCRKFEALVAIRDHSYEGNMMDQFILGLKVE